MKLKRLPVVTVLALVAMSAGIEAEDVWEMTVEQFVAALTAARRRRVS